MTDLGSNGAKAGDTPLGRSRALVVAASGGIAALLDLLSASAMPLAADLMVALEKATRGGDNLLKARRARDEPRLLASLARDEDGHLHAAKLALDPAAVVLVTDDGRGALDRLVSAKGADIAPAALALRKQLERASSALSVATARLDLQARFVEAILDEDGENRLPAAETLDADGALAAAQAIGVMLSKTPLAIGAGNRRALDSLFAAMVSGGAPT